MAWSKSWANEKVLEFLELYKSEEILWNPKHISHRNRIQVTDAWERIRLNLGMNCLISDLKRKKESLMVTYRFIKKKNSPSYRSAWFAFPLMDSFLGEKYKFDNCVDNDEWVETTEFIDTGSFTTEELEEATDDEVVDSKTIIEIDNEDEIDSNIKPQIKCFPSNRKRRKKNLLSEKEQWKCSNSREKFKIKEQPTNYFQEDIDECDLYCQLLAKKLKKLDDNQRDIAMHEIDNIMFRTKRGLLNNMNNSSDFH